MCIDLSNIDLPMCPFVKHMNWNLISMCITSDQFGVPAHVVRGRTSTASHAPGRGIYVPVVAFVISNLMLSTNPSFIEMIFLIIT